MRVIRASKRSALCESISIYLLVQICTNLTKGNVYVVSYMISLNSHDLPDNAKLSFSEVQSRDFALPRWATKVHAYERNIVHPETSQWKPYKLKHFKTAPYARASLVSGSGSPTLSCLFIFQGECLPKVGTFPLYVPCMDYDPPSASQCVSVQLTCPVFPALFTQLGRLIGSLPQELVSEIFIWVCDDGPSTSLGFIYTTMQALHLSHVSRFWRDVALRTPRLWTNLQIIVRKANLEPALELVKLWVPRSMSRPMSIGVTFKDNHGEYLLFPQDTLTLFRAITKAAALLKETRNRSTLAKAYFETHIRSGSYGVVPVLEERYQWYSGVSDPPNPTEILNLPLTVLGAWQTVDEFGSDFHGRLRNSLTKIDLRDTNGITCVSNSELLVILAEFPLLRHLSANINLGDSPPNEIVIANNLISFDLSWLYITDIGPLLDELVAPNLQELQLSGEIAAGGPWNHLLDFFDRSKPPIRQLSLRELDGGPSRLSDCLAMLTHLETLWLEFCILDTSFPILLSRKFLSDRGRPAVLKTLGIVTCENITGNQLLHIFKDIQFISCLKELYVFDCPGFTEPQCNELHRLFSGTNVEVRTLVSP